MGRDACGTQISSPSLGAFPLNFASPLHFYKKPFMIFSVMSSKYLFSDIGSDLEIL